MKLMAGLPQAMLVSTHDLAMAAELFPRTVIMDSGKVVADGATSGILANDRLLEEHGLENPYRQK